MTINFETFDFKKSTKIQLANLPLRISLRELRKRAGVTVLVGRVESGVLKPGTNVVLASSPTKAQVKWNEVNRERVGEACFNVGDVPDGVGSGTVVSERPKCRTSAKFHRSAHPF